MLLIIVLYLSGICLCFNGLFYQKYSWHHMTLSCSMMHLEERKVLSRGRRILLMMIYWFTNIPFILGVSSVLIISSLVIRVES